MKNIKIVLIVLLFNTLFFSCTPESIVDKATPQACCGESGEIPPPPPPPPGDNGLNGG